MSRNGEAKSPDEEQLDFEYDEDSSGEIEARNEGSNAAASQVRRIPEDSVRVNSSLDHRKRPEQEGARERDRHNYRGDYYHQDHEMRLCSSGTSHQRGREATLEVGGRSRNASSEASPLGKRRRSPSLPAVESEGRGSRYNSFGSDSHDRRQQPNPKNDSPPRRNFNRSPSPRAAIGRFRRDEYDKPQHSSDARQANRPTRQSIADHTALSKIASSQCDNRQRDTTEHAKHGEHPKSDEARNAKRKEARPDEDGEIETSEKLDAPTSTTGPRTKYFVARCNYYDIFAKAKRSLLWRAPEYIVSRIKRANSAVDNVLLFFTVHQTAYFQGVAKIDNQRNIERPSGSERLWRVPLTWTHMTDVPFYSLPRVPGLIDQEDGVKESFEIPSEHAERILTLFDRLSKDTLSSIPSFSKDPLSTTSSFSKDPLSTTSSFSKDPLSTTSSFSKDVEACLLDKQEQSPTQNGPVQ